MSASGSQMPTDDGSWFQPDTYSLWAWDRGGEGKPALIAVYEWERAGLRGVYFIGAWGDLGELGASREVWDTDYTMLQSEVIQQEHMNSLAFAELIATGHMHRIGSMPSIEGYMEPPPGMAADEQQTSTTDQVRTPSESVSD